MISSIDTWFLRQSYYANSDTWKLVIRQKAFQLSPFQNTEVNAGKCSNSRNGRVTKMNELSIKHQTFWLKNKALNIKISLSVDNMALKLEVMELPLSVHFQQCVLCALTFILGVTLKGLDDFSCALIYGCRKKKVTWIVPRNNFSARVEAVSR